MRMIALIGICLVAGTAIAAAQTAPDSRNGSVSGEPTAGSMSTGSMYNGNNTRPLITLPPGNGTNSVAANDASPAGGAKATHPTPGTGTAAGGSEAGTHTQNGGH